jgi:general secretion pathway protein F
MPAYRFEAASAAGRIERGIVDADSPRQARGVLRERGLTPISVATVEDRAAGGAGSMVIGGRLKDADLAMATRQLASLLSARLPPARRWRRRWANIRATFRMCIARWWPQASSRAIWAW